MRPVLIPSLLSLLAAVSLLAASADLRRGFPVRAVSEGNRVWESTVPDAVQAQAAADSQQVLEAARSQQSRFERLRRSRLYQGARSPGRRCYEIVGRYCLRRGGDEDEPRPEAAEVGAARAELILQLEEAARRLPGDEWIAGQRVRYLVEAGRQVEALEAARDCRAAAGWWCIALRGYALHSAGEYGAAESTFAAALSFMPEDERCRWTDISHLLDGHAHRQYDRLACDERASLEALLWWLAQPLQMLSANDRRTEHLARRALDRMQRRASSPFGEPWGPDLSELLIRFGWPGRFERVSYPTGTGSIREEIVSHDPPNSRQFVPSFDFLQGVGAIRQEDWQLDTETPKSVYAPAYASTFKELDHQLAVFPRGDSVVVVAGYQLATEDTIDSLSYEAALVISGDPAAAPATARSSGATKGVLAVVAAAEPTLMSLELLSAPERQAARSRYGLDLSKVPAGLLALSDLLLLERGDTLPDSLTAAIPRVRTRARARAGEPLGVYWELFGLGPGAEELAISITLAKEDASWLRRTAEWLGLADRKQPLTLAWEEQVPEPTPVLARSLALELPEELEAGVYTFTLQVTPFGRETLTSTRAIDVVR